MSSWGFESQEEWLKLLKLYDNLHIHVKNENDPWCLLPQFSQLPIGQMSKVRSVLKSACSQLFKTALTFDFWQHGSWDIGAKTHQGSFLFFTWIWRRLFSFSICNHSSGLSKPQFDILYYFLWYCQHKRWGFLQKKY